MGRWCACITTSDVHLILSCQYTWGPWTGEGNGIGIAIYCMDNRLIATFFVSAEACVQRWDFCQLVSMSNYLGRFDVCCLSSLGQILICLFWLWLVALWKFCNQICHLEVKLRALDLQLLECTWLAFGWILDEKTMRFKCSGVQLLWALSCLVEKLQRLNWIIQFGWSN